MGGWSELLAWSTPGRRRRRSWIAVRGSRRQRLWLEVGHPSGNETCGCCRRGSTRTRTRIGSPSRVGRRGGMGRGRRPSPARRSCVGWASVVRVRGDGVVAEGVIVTCASLLREENRRQARGDRKKSQTGRSGRSTKADVVLTSQRRASEERFWGLTNHKPAAKLSYETGLGNCSRSSNLELTSEALAGPQCGDACER